MVKSTTGGERPRQQPRSQAPEATPTETVRRPGRGTALGTAIGFACGAVFWHALGFAGVHFKAPADPKGEAAYALADAGGASPLETGSLPTIYRVDPAVCTILELDRQANRTVDRPCPADGLALRLDSGDDREDFAILVDNETR
jgi:hypothetical protein